MKPSTSCAKEAESNTVTSSTTCIHKQTMDKYHDHHVVPVKQQEILHDFLFRINQGTFCIPFGGKVCHHSPGMNYVSWPLGKSALFPRTLAQLTCQDFKKDPPGSNTAVPSPSLPILHLFYNSSTLAELLDDKFPCRQAMILAVYLLLLSLWPKLIATVQHLDGLAASMLCSNALITLAEDFSCYQVSSMLWDTWILCSLSTLD